MKCKICGITDSKEAAYLNEAGADYAGFVFFEKSKRNISPGQAKMIFPELSLGIQKAAVMVSPDPAMVEEIQNIGFDLLQIHKKLTREVIEAAKIPIWYAFNAAKQEELEEKMGFIGSLPQNLQEKITGIVVDAANYGSGQTFDWHDRSLRWRSSPVFQNRIFILAGGLNSENVAEGIRIFSPDVVDVSSGVEYLPESGKKGKDPDRVKAFCRNAKAAATDD